MSAPLILLTQSASICRLCGSDSGPTNCIFEHPQDQDLAAKIDFFLPIQMIRHSPFPTRICSTCYEDFCIVSAFFIRLNRGQLRLADKLASAANVVIPMPDWIQGDKKRLSLFSVKYPAMPPAKKGPVMRKTTVQVRNEPQHAPATGSPSTRSRRIPLRLKDCVQGKELDKMFLNVSSTPCLVSKESGGEQHTVHREQEASPASETMASATSPLPDPKECGECGQTFSCCRTLDQHLDDEHRVDGVTFSCPLCSFTPVPGRSQFLEHLESVHKSPPQRQLNCSDCGRRFYHDSSLQRHRLNDHASPELTCSRCLKAFDSRGLLNDHLASVHSTDNRPHCCGVCQRTFKSGGNLRAHEATHSRPSHFSCDLCGKKFGYKSSLRLHTQWHQGHKAFKCDFCGKQFHQHGNLVEHIRIHTGDKPFECSVCSRRFTTSSQYKLHQKRHQGVRQWKCEHCDKAFLQKVSWRAHCRRHTGEKPFACHICKKAFTEMCGLNKHLRLHTGVRPYACKVCHKTFSDRSNLDKHTRTHVKHNLALAKPEASISSANPAERQQHLARSSGSTVWNIIQQATCMQDSDILTQSGDQQHQIIYIAYDSCVQLPVSGPCSSPAASVSETVAVPAAASTSLPSSDVVDLVVQLPETAGPAPADLHKISDSVMASAATVPTPNSASASDANLTELNMKPCHMIQLKVPLNLEPVNYAADFLPDVPTPSETVPKPPLSPS